MECEHNYEILTDNLDTVVTGCGNGEVTTNTTGYVVFYCTKCLDIQKKVIEWMKQKNLK